MSIHHFQPSHYHVTLGSHESVLRIADGDTVATTTVDACGGDHHEQITQPGNPQTGPFYIEGAEPGDTLVLGLDRLTPNCTCGFTGAMVAPNVVDPAYMTVCKMPKRVLEKAKEGRPHTVTTSSGV